MAAPAIAQARSNPGEFRAALGMPINGVSVTDPQYGGIDDGRSGWFFAAWTKNTTGLTLFSSNVAVTIANTGPGGVAQLTMPGTTSGFSCGPQPEWVGQPIAIVGPGVAGGTFVARVTGFFYDTANNKTATAVLNIAAPTPLTNSVRQVACPCFTNGIDGSGLPTDVGKKLWIGNGGSLTGAGTFGIAPITLGIAAYVSPFAVTLGGNITANTQTASGGNTLIRWGTDNTAAIVTAGTAALYTGRKVLFFPGLTKVNSTRLFCAFDYETNGGTPPATDFVRGYIASALHWIGSDATLFAPLATGSLGNTLFGGFQPNSMRALIPWNAPPPPAAQVTFDGRQLLRCATLDTIVIAIGGDSWGNKDPTGTFNGVWAPAIKQLIRQNLGRKTIHVVNAAINGLAWNDLKSTIDSISTVTVDGLGTVTPDLVLLAVTGMNDKSSIHTSDIVACINKVRAWPKKNGYAPDVAMITGSTPRTFAGFTAIRSTDLEAEQYATVLQRSLARKLGIPFLDYGRVGAFALRGWSEDALVPRQVPPVPAGTAGPLVPYRIPCLGNDYILALKLGTALQSGATFWGLAGALSVTMSAKPDNRLWFAPDASNNLTVTGVTWGVPLATPAAMTNGAAGLTTSGHTSWPVGTTLVLPYAPSYQIVYGPADITAGVVGQSFLAVGSYGANNEDFRTWIGSRTNGGIIFGADAAPNTAVHPSAIYTGGAQFIASDALAQADCIVAGAGGVTHPLTGANSLVTKVAGFTSRTSVTLADLAAADVATTASVFTGRIHQQPTYSVPVSVGDDAGLQPVLLVRVQGTRVEVGYLMGGTSLADIRTAIRISKKFIWTGEVERFGGVYTPQVFAKNGTVTLECIGLWVGDIEANLHMPSMTMLEAFGVADGDTNGVSNFFTGLGGGDTAHPAHPGLEIIAEASATQPMAIPDRYGDAITTVVPTTGFTIAMANNVGGLNLQPAGTLAAGTITLPSVYPQNGEIEVFTAQTITSLTVSAPGGKTLQGAAVTTLAAGGVLRYRLRGTVWRRVL